MQLFERPVARYPLLLLLLRLLPLHLLRLLLVASPRQAFWNHQGWLVQLFERPVARYPLLLLLLLPPGDVKLLRWQACEAPLGAKVVTGAAQVCTRSA